MMRIDPVERHLFLEGVFLKYGYDFRQYSEASLNRRLGVVLNTFGEGSLLNVLKRSLESADFFRQVLPYLTINTTEFFRDPSFFRMLREKVFPVLQTYPTIKIWVAGCSTGEEIYSLAIALQEERLLSRSVIYATDINPEVLRRATEGIYDLATIQAFAKNYVAGGGTRSPSEYYTAEYGLVRFDPQLRENLVFSQHNLVTDSVFAEMHLILCRNVLIYFTRELQDRVFQLFSQSLVFRGFLGIGSKESLRFSQSADLFDTIDGPEKIFQLKARSLESTVRRPFGGRT